MAASVIDALVVTLGLDASNYQRGSKEVSAGLKTTRDDAGKTAKELETQGKRAAGFFSSIKNEMLALAGVSLTIGGLTSFVKNTTSGLRQMAVQSQALGMSARQLDGWSKAAEAAGSSAEKITGTLGNFQSAIQAYRNGDASSPLFKALAMLNGDTGITFDPMRQDSDSLMRTAAQALQQERSGDRARYIAQMMGIDDATFQSMRSGQFTRDVDRYSQQSGISDADVKNAQKFNREWTDLQQRLEKIGYIIYGALSPYIEQFTGYLTRLAEWMAQHPKEIEGAVKSFFGTIADIASVCDEAAQAVGGWKNVILGLIGLKVVSWALGFANALKTMLALSVPGGGKGAGFIGKMGVYGAVGAALYDPVDSGLTSVAGKDNKKTLDSYGFWMASDWTPFFKRDEYEKYQATLDKSGGAAPATDKQLDALKKNQDNAIRDDKRTADESRGQRNRTNELLSKMLDIMAPPAAADALEPNIVSELSPAPAGSPRGIRNNNPGNLNYVGQQGATLERPGGRFARFETPFDGLRAMGNQLMRYFTGKTTGQALDSVRKIISTWAPGNENNTGAYIRSVSRSLGVAPDARLNLRDPQVLSVLMGAITQHENGRNPYDTGLIARAAQAVTTGIRPGAGMNIDRSAPQRETAQTGPQYHIGNVTVQSPASRVDQLTADISRTAHNRTRALGSDSRQS